MTNKKSVQEFEEEDKEDIPNLSSKVKGMKFWKWTAIISILLLVMGILIFVGLYSVGNKLIDNDNKCAAICADIGFYEYDDDLTCYCINGDMEVVERYYLNDGEFIKVG